jgi:hypothetical protein
MCTTIFTHPDSWRNYKKREDPPESLWKRRMGKADYCAEGQQGVTLTPPMSDIEKRLEDMDRTGFDVQILTLSIPSVDIFPVDVGETLAKVVNDEIAGSR